MRYIAADFGAGSSRVIIGSIENNHIELEEVHRFPTRIIKDESLLCWDFPYLLQELKHGIKKAIEKYSDIISIGVDTWGVDFGLIDEHGNLVSNPVCYRDERTNGVSQKVFEKVSKDKMYAVAGTQIMEINTIFQLAVMQLNADNNLKIANHLLFMPDLFNYFLTGKKLNEYTIASTSSLLNATTKQWSDELIHELNLPNKIFCEIVQPGNIIGRFSKNICDELGCDALNVVAVGSHDTASAAAVTYRKEPGTAFLSSGTWSLLGMFIEEPILNEETLNQNITNEGGLNSKILFLRNITGLWIFENLVKEFEKSDSGVNYTTLLNEAAGAKSILPLIDPDDERFNQPESMCAAISGYYSGINSGGPETRGEFVRVVLESLANKYKLAIENIEKCTGERIRQIHIVGGGSKNEFLCQLTANATGLTVMAGPVEATAIGNIVVQAIANDSIKNMDEASEIIERSFEVKYYKPER